MILCTFQLLFRTLLMFTALQYCFVALSNSVNEDSKIVVDGIVINDDEIWSALRFLSTYKKLLRQYLLSEQTSEEKRSLDFGLGRGFSGSLAAKHLLGWKAANFAGGPGRKRRDADHH